MEDKKDSEQRKQEEPVELPPNRPMGLLGEPGLNVMKVDNFEPQGLNAGLIQESTYETRLLVILLLYFIFFPAAYVVLWVSKRIPMRAKIVVTALMTAGLVAVAYAIWM